MLKIISAAVVAASLMVAPAMATTVIKHKPITHSHALKPSVANANAHMVKKHHRHHARPHHHAHKHMAAKRHHH